MTGIMLLMLTQGFEDNNTMFVMMLAVMVVLMMFWKTAQWKYFEYIKENPIAICLRSQTESVYKCAHTRYLFGS